MTNNATVTLPLIHINGSGKQNLLSAYQNAYLALSNAKQALAEAYPDMRDYYPLGEHVWKQAMAEHRARLEAIDRIMDEIQQIAEHIMSHMVKTR